LRIIKFQDSSGRLVGGPGFKGAAGGGCHELDEIAVVSSSADPLHLKYGGEVAGQPIACNGPRLVPGKNILIISPKNVYRYYTNFKISDTKSTIR